MARRPAQPSAPPIRVEVDPEELRRLAAGLAELEGGKKLQAALRKNLKAAAEPAAAQVRANAAWSSRIPAAVAVRVAFTSKRPGVAVLVNRRKAPHARPLENDGKPGTFLAPVFGRRKGDAYVTAARQARPFFFTDLAKTLPDVERAALDALDEAARAAGFRPTT